MTSDGLIPPLNAPAGQATPVGVTPGVSQAVVVANRVIVIGAHGEILLYSGTPAAGNLVASIAATSGSDAYGNSWGAGFSSFSGLNSAELTAAALTFGVGTNTIASLNPSGFFLYSPSIGLGNLVASITPAAGTDASGNAYLAGISGYFSTGSGGHYDVANLNAAQLNFFQNASFGGAYTQYGEINVGFTSSYTLKFSLASAVMFDVQGPLGLLNATSAPAAETSYAMLYASSGHLKYVDPSGAAYDTGRVTGRASGQTVNATTFSPLTGMTVALGVATYTFRAVVFLTAAASAGLWEIELLFSGTATVNYAFRYMSALGVAALDVNNTSFGVNLTGPSPSVAGAYWAEIEGSVVVTAAGSLSLSGATSVAADTWTNYNSSYIEAFPVV